MKWAVVAQQLEAMPVDWEARVRDSGATRRSELPSLSGRSECVSPPSRHCYVTFMCVSI